MHTKLPGITTDSSDNGPLPSRVGRNRSKLRVFCAGGLVVTGLSAACSSNDTATNIFTVRDSAGIRIAQSAAPIETNPWVVNPTPDVEIRGDFGEPDHYLYNARYMAPLSDGRLVVGNSGTNQLFFFSADGAFSYARGRDGDGPGEMRRIFGLARCEDDRIVIEELRRLSLFDGSGRFIRTVPITGHLAEFRANVAGVSPDCSAALLAVNSRRAPEPGEDVFALQKTLYWASFDDGARDTVGTILAVEGRTWITRDGRLSVARIPYGREAVWASFREDLLLGLAHDYEIQRIDRSGRLTEIIRWNGPQQAVTPEEWSYFTNSLEQLYRDDPEEREYGPPLEHFQRPEAKPPYSALLVDDEGRIWVQRYGRYSIHGAEPSGDWWLFDATGKWVANVSMPAGLQVVAIMDDRVMGFVLDEFDVQHIRIHRLPVPTGTSQ